MSILNILQHPDATLRQRSVEVTQFDASLHRLVEDLFATLAHYGGIGMSAPQLGRLERVLVVNVPGDDYGARAYINPEIIARARKGFVEESCLSVPGVVGNVFRATRVCVRYLDREGKRFEQDLDGMHAVCLQHEIDHLDGILFTDRLSWLKKLSLRLSGQADVTAGARTV